MSLREREWRPEQELEKAARARRLLRGCHWHLAHSKSPHLPKRLQLALALSSARLLKVTKPRQGRQKAKLLMPCIPASQSISITSLAAKPGEPESVGPALLAACTRGDIRQARFIMATAAGRGSQHVDGLMAWQEEGSGNTPLAAACAGGHVAVARLLLLKGASAYVWDELDVSPLMQAAAGGHTDTVQLLLEEGNADFYHISSVTGRTALMEAVVGGHEDCARLLLVMGADPRQESEDKGMHPLLLAACHGHLDMARLLLTQPPGCKVNQTDKQGCTALTTAARLGDVRMIKLLLASGAKSIAEFGSGRTPLMEACSQGHAPAVRVLLEAGLGQFQATDAQGRTALDLAACRPAVLATISQFRASEQGKLERAGATH